MEGFAVITEPQVFYSYTLILQPLCIYISPLSCSVFNLPCYMQHDLLTEMSCLYDIRFQILKPSQFNMTCISIPANDSTPVQHLDDLWSQGSIISGVNEPLLQLCCLDASLAVKPVLDRFQSVIITSGKLENWCVGGLIVTHIDCIAILPDTKYWSVTTYDNPSCIIEIIIHL